jgi:hypothetical protein
MPANAFSNGMQFDYERNGPRQDSEGTNVTSQPERTARPALLLPRAASAGRSQGAVTKSRLNIEHLYDESIFLLAKSYIEKKIQKAARKETEIKRASPQKAQASADRFVEPLKRPVINNIVVDGKVLLSIKSSFIDSALRAMIDELRTSARH